jgi:hypothetical protein
MRAREDPYGTVETTFLWLSTYNTITVFESWLAR